MLHDVELTFNMYRVRKINPDKLVFHQKYIFLWFCLKWKKKKPLFWQDPSVNNCIGFSLIQILSVFVGIFSQKPGLQAGNIEPVNNDHNLKNSRINY